MKLALLILGFLLCSLSPAQADSYTATSIDVPGSTCTMAFGINAKGQIVGGYCDDHGCCTASYWQRSTLAK